MRRSALLFGITCILIITYLLYSVSTLLSLLIEDCAEDAIHRSELPSQNSSLIDTRPQLIPKIIHQTYKNESIPLIWKDAQRSCIDLHHDYEYILWTDAKAEDFIAREYPWFLETFKAYEYPIQRADSIRYFVLAHYGGIYIDLDDGCNRRLDPLLSYPAWLRRTSPTGISNDAMGSVPQHPFFLYVIDSLQSYNRHWFLPYITVMYSTGPLFLSVIWKQWMTLRGPAESDRVRVLMKDAYNRYTWSFFTYHEGSSWHGKDAQLIFWMGQNWMFLTLLGITLVLAVGLMLFKCYSRIIAIKGCAALPWPLNRIAGLCCNLNQIKKKRNEFKARGGYSTPLPSTYEPSISTSNYHTDYNHKDDDGDIAYIKDKYEARGGRRSLAAGAASQSLSQVATAAAGQTCYDYSDEKQQQQRSDNNLAYTLTPTISNASTVISESLPDHLEMHYPPLHYSHSNLDLHPNHHLHPFHHSKRNSDNFAPATATNAYPTQKSSSFRSSSSRLRLPTLSYFLGGGGSGGSSNSSSNSNSSGSGIGAGAGAGNDDDDGDDVDDDGKLGLGETSSSASVCGLTGEDVEAQSVTLARYPLHGSVGGGMAGDEVIGKEEGRRRQR
ncbi:hypothetical protein KEM54_005884 [Ascosphaera aggregata]|nr:hypothetical protein KEM54_005884 [Ascosphaera aggregata]